ncbi:MAG: F-type H+-transporting ATPase subunit b [Alphaproteobacteria bacterium]|jgi:F-type H+-transporting ATPase subunit b|nr:F-type H+-transporting ATPase subunit b [Alphaproteobacteria bacterium]
MATTAHTEAPEGGHKGAFPPFQAETFASQLVWLAITFTLLYLLAAKIVLPRIGGIIEARRAHIDDDLAEANRLKAESDAAIAAYEKSLANARARAQALANETRERQTAEAERNRKLLEEKLNAKLAEAEKTIAATKTAAMANVRGIASEAASAIVQRLIGSAPSADALNEAVADVLKR